MTAGQDAVAALWWDADQTKVVVVVVGSDGQPATLTVTEPRIARQMIDLAVGRALDDIENGDRTTTPKRIQGGAWAVRLRCPDGRSRLFVERRRARKTPRPAMSPNTRWEVLVRDGFRCRYCGVTGDDARLHVDHVRPVSAGGSDDPANLVTACETCNAGKSDARFDGDRLPIGSRP